jgi:hypothetical protein
MAILPGRLTQVNVGTSDELRALRACPSAVSRFPTSKKPRMKFTLRTARAPRCLALLATLVLAACATPQPLPIAEVMQRSQSGQSADEVTGAVRAARTTYALRGSDFGKLRQAGVSDPVLDYLQQSFMDDVDLLTRYWVLGESVGGCARCVPQQVDLSDVAAPNQAPTSTAYHGYGPQGMPDWYRPYSARLKSVSLDNLVQMAKLGTPDEELVAMLRDSRLAEPVIGAQSPLSGIRTHPVATLSGSELARLREQGVPDPVLDEIQTKFLGQFVELARLRYQNLGKGPAGPNP